VFNRNSFEWTLVGYPVCISDPKYHRNALIFNVVFLFDRVENYASSSVRQYEAVVKKIATLFRTLEVCRVATCVLKKRTFSNSKRVNSCSE
jgi:hypothetical protein